MDHYRLIWKSFIFTLNLNKTHRSDGHTCLFLFSNRNYNNQHTCTQFIDYIDDYIGSATDVHLYNVRWWQCWSFWFGLICSCQQHVAQSENMHAHMHSVFRLQSIIICRCQKIGFVLLQDALRHPYIVQTISWQSKVGNGIKFWTNCCIFKGKTPGDFSFNYWVNRILSINERRIERHKIASDFCPSAMTWVERRTKFSYILFQMFIIISSSSSWSSSSSSHLRRWNISLDINYTTPILIAFKRNLEPIR